MGQCPLSALLVRSPQMVWECVCVCVGACACVRVCGWTEWTWSMHYVGISTYQFIPHYASAIQCKHTHIFKPFEDSLQTGLKVDIANYGCCIIPLVTLLYYIYKVTWIQRSHMTPLDEAKNWCPSCVCKHAKRSHIYIYIYIICMLQILQFMEEFSGWWKH